MLLFQSSEENGTGAQHLLSEKRFQDLGVEYAYALHNIPGYETGKILVRDDDFTYASRGVIISFKGTAAHSSEPEKGRSTAGAIGEMNFGTVPGSVQLMAVVRSRTGEMLDQVCSGLVKAIRDVATRHSLDVLIDYSENYMAVRNDKEAADFGRKAAQDEGLTVNELSEPFHWSEDFGRFAEKSKIAIFGIGAGRNTPFLHMDDYQFPDVLLEHGLRLLYRILKNHLG